MPRSCRKASASAARLPSTSGKWTSRKLPTLGVTVRPRLVSSASSQPSHISLWAMAVSTWAVSSMAAAPAAIAAAPRLNGPRTRLTASTTAAGPYIQPMRSAARPWIFEKVLSMTTLSIVAASSSPAE